MHRRVVGALTLIVALALMLVMPRLLSPGIGGMAAAAPLPTGPAVGSCVLGWPREVDVVACDRPHDGEVVELVSPQDVSRAMVCGVATEAYLGGPPETNLGVRPPTDRDWQDAAMRYDHKVLLAPPAESLGGLRWRACMIFPTSGLPYIGSVRSAGGGGVDVPDAFRTCLSAANDRVACTESHRSELLGEMSLPALNGLLTAPEFNPAVLEPSRWQAGCAKFGSTVVGGTDPTRQGTLDYVVDTIDGTSLSYLGPNGAALSVAIPQCKAQYRGPTPLIGSVVGLGDGALPVE